jgi:hypothetical protein
MTGKFRYREIEIDEHIVSVLVRDPKWGIFFRVEYDGILVWQLLMPFSTRRDKRAINKMTAAHDKMEAVIRQLEEE